ncbi:MAG: hypothetical protein SGCHY_003447 [Lobulomycetales sp.]
MSPTMKDARGMPGTLKKTIETGAHRSLGSIGRFLSEGDVVNITVGFILAETAYVVFTSLVVDILTPLGAAITPDTQLEHRHIVLRPAPVCVNGTETYNPEECSMLRTFQEAQERGAVTWNWGQFISNLIQFLLIILLLFFAVKLYYRLFRQEYHKKKDCIQCFSSIDRRAKRCPHCISYQTTSEGRSAHDDIETQ